MLVLGSVVCYVVRPVLPSGTCEIIIDDILDLKLPTSGREG